MIIGQEFILTNNDIARSDTNPLTLITPPRNSEKSKRTFKRSIDNFATFSTFSDDFEFTKEAYIFLNEAYLFKDTEANVDMEEWRDHPETEVRFLHSKTTFNFAKIKVEELSIKIPFKTGGLNKLIKSQLKEKFELERTESINGNPIDELITNLVALTSREIPLVSQLQTDPADDISTAFRMNFSDGNFRTGSLGVPTNITIDSDEKLAVSIKDLSFTTTPNTGKTASLFYFNNDITKTLQVKIKMRCKIVDRGTGNTSNKVLRVDLARFNNGATLDLVSRTILVDVPIPQFDGFIVDFEFEEDIVLLAGESLSLQWYAEGNFGGFLASGNFKMDFEETIATIDIFEDSQREDSQTKAVLFHEAGEKLMQIITGDKDRYISQFYGRIDLGYAQTGEFALTAFALGLWIRLFNDKKIEMSFDDFLNTSNAIHNTGFNVEIINDVECLVHEDLKYFFQDATAIILLNEINNVIEEPAELLYHSSLLFGYKKPEGDNLYEEAQGLNEYNARTGYSNNLTSTDKTYKKISSARADSIAKELARRKLQINFPEEDTRYDKGLHLLDLIKRFGTIFEERVWQDDFEEAPTGIFSPDTATNLRITPLRNRERHEWFFSSILQKHPEEFLRFSNSDGNSDLSTKKVGEAAKSERGDTKNSDLQRALFESKFISFEHEITFDIDQQLFGKTEINGRLIPNCYFKVQYKYRGQLNFGYLFEVIEQEKQIGKWRLLKAL